MRPLREGVHAMVRFPMLHAFRELAIGEWYLEKSMPKKVVKAFLMALLAVPTMLAVHGLFLAYRKRVIREISSAPVAVWMEALREVMGG